MASSVDKSLDEIIKEKHITGRMPRKNGGPNSSNRGSARGIRGANRFRGAGRGGGLGRRPNNGAIIKRRSGPPGLSASPHKAVAAAAASINGQWDHDLYQNGNGALRRAGAALAANQTGGPAKLIISNLDFGVNDQDIKGLFQEFGNIRKAAVHYDRSGRSLGTADVVFERKPDAIRALKKYNRVSLDGRPMDIRLTATLSAVAQELSPRKLSSLPRRGGPGSGGRGGPSGRRGGRGGRGAGRQQATPKTQADLDADLDAYTAKMQTD